MSKDTPWFAEKDRIDHAVYGSGTVLETNRRHTTILFDEAGTKKFVTSMVKLSRCETPAPAKPVRRKKKVAKSK